MRANSLFAKWISVSILAGGMILSAEDSKIPAMSVTPVEDTATVIAEKSLKANGALAARAQGGGLQVSGGFAASQDGGAMVGGQVQQQSDKSEQPNGSSVYGFLLQPGERITITKSGESLNKIAMKIMEPNTANAMTAVVQRVNRAARPIRVRRVELQNVLSEPFRMILLLYGEVGYPFELKIERKGKKN